MCGHPSGAVVEKAIDSSRTDAFSWHLMRLLPEQVIFIFTGFFLLDGKTEFFCSFGFGPAKINFVGSGRGIIVCVLIFLEFNF